MAAMEKTPYERPVEDFGGLVNRFLGKLPESAVEIDGVYVQRPLSTSQRYLAIAMAVTAWAVVVGLLAFFPVMRFGLFSVFSTPPVSQTTPQLAASFVLMVLVSCLILGLSRGQAGEAYRRAAREEMRYRAGTEKWNWWQRFSSCLMFGLCQPVAWVFPLPTVPVMVTVGAVLMAVYLREYRHGDYWEAALASAKVRATFSLLCLYVLRTMMAAGIAIGLIGLIVLAL